MTNPGGRLPRSVVPPETMLIDHEGRIKILERRLVNSIDPSTINSLLFSQAVAQIVVSGSYRISSTRSITRVTLSCGTAPVGSNLVVTTRLNGATVATSTIVAGSTDPVTQVVNIPVVDGDLLSVAASSVGSTTPAHSVVLQLELGSGV